MIHRKESASAHYYAKRTQQQQYHAGSGMQTRSMLPSTKWLTSEILIHWIQQNKIINELFGEKMHHELLKRSNEIFKFLVIHDTMEKEYLDALWNSCLGKQEQVMEASFGILSEIVGQKEFSNQLIDYIMQNKINEFPTSSYDIHFINLLSDIQFVCLNKNISQYTGYPMELLWKAVQDSSGINEEIFDETLTLLEKLFCKLKDTDYFIQLCFTNIGEHKSSPQSQKIIMKLLSRYQPTVQHHFSSSSSSAASSQFEKMIKHCENKFDMTSKFFNDFFHYHQIASVKSQKLSPEKRDSAKYASGYYSHLTRVQIHLEFLEFILSNGKLPIEKENLSSLWESIIEKSLSPAEQTLGFQWFSSFCDKVVLKSEILKYLFEQKVCSSFDFTSITSAGYLCFKGLFFAINRSQDNLITSGGNFRVKNLNLIGIDTLWQIIFIVEDKNVCDDAVTFLSTLYEKLAPELKNQQDTLRKNLILKIMKQLENANSMALTNNDTTTINPQSEFRIKRCLMLLQRFIKLYNNSPSSYYLSSSQSSDQQGASEIKLLIVSSTNDKHFTISVKRNQTLLDLCKLISSQVNDIPSYAHVQLYYCGNAINRDVYAYKTLHSLNVSNGSKFNYAKTSSPYNHQSQPQSSSSSSQSSQQQSSLSSTSYQPREFLANDNRCFEQLFHLLDFNNDIADKVWELINQLPVNPTRYEKLLHIDEGTNWDEILPTHSTLQLLYSLQIIHSIMTTTPSSSDDQIKHDNWMKHFENGFKKLLDLFYSYQEKINGIAKRKTTETLLNIINIFMLTTSDPDLTTLQQPLQQPLQQQQQIRYVLKDNLTYVQFPSLIKQLLDVIWDSAKDSIENPDNSNSSLLSTQEPSSSSSSSSQKSHSRSSSTSEPQQQQQPMNSSVSESDHSFNSEIVKHAGSLLVAILFSNTNYLSNLYDFPNLREFVHCVTIEAEQSICDEMAKGICQLCLELPKIIQNQSGQELDPRRVFIPLLLDFLKEIPSNSMTCSEYFGVTNKLISQLLLQSSNNNNDGGDTSSRDVLHSIQFNENEFIQLLIELIQNHPIVEANENAKQQIDIVFIGLSNLLESVITLHPENKTQIPVSFTEYLFKHCLFEIPITETSGSSTSSSTTTRGSPSSAPVCKTIPSRKACFSLLKALSSSSSSLDCLLHLIHDIHLTSDIHISEWNYSPSAEQRSDVGYVGIKNLGCICYMISLLQQLFMIPKFRSGILSLPLPKEYNNTQTNMLCTADSNNNSQDSSGSSACSSLDDNLLYQLQLMYANLQESCRQYYDPTPFCKSNKDYDGQPTDVSIQMDADEFFNMLCEKVEEGLKKSSQEKLLKNIWCGNLCSQLICQECKTNSERDEAFFTVSLDIKNKNSILEALEFYVQGELLTGGNKYSCEKCDKKVDALMRRCLKTLPSVLILHLKRFEFNFDTMRKLKLNDYCEFPMTLNMKPYTREGIKQMEEQQENERKALISSDASIPVPDDDDDEDASNDDDPDSKPTPGGEDSSSSSKAGDDFIIQPDDYYNYELVGILIHRGVADSGHYYSFIKLRHSNTDSDQWVEFNDEIVRPFDIDSIEKECFGGTEKIGEGHRFAREINRTRNAYMLIYERKYNNDNNNTTTTSTPTSSDQTTTPTNTPVTANADNDDNDNSNKQLSSCIYSQKAEENFQIQMPKQLYEHIWTENRKFLMDKKLFDPEYAQFCYYLASSIEIPEDREYKVLHADDVHFQKLRILIDFFIRILIHSKESEIIEKYGECLRKNIFERSVPICVWFLQLCSREHIKLWLLRCTLPESRRAIALLISESIRNVFPFTCSLNDEEDDEEEDEEDDDDEDDDNDVAAVADLKYINREVLSVMSNLCYLLNIVNVYWQTFGEFFLVFKEFAKLSHHAVCGFFFLFYIFTLKE